MPFLVGLEQQTGIFVLTEGNVGHGMRVIGFGKEG
jgi:hypothetical protein